MLLKLLSVQRNIFDLVIIDGGKSRHLVIKDRNIKCIRIEHMGKCFF